jgi:hypothetical protein
MMCIKCQRSQTGRIVREYTEDWTFNGKTYTDNMVDIEVEAFGSVRIIAAVSRGAEYHGRYDSKGRPALARFKSGEKLHPVSPTFWPCECGLVKMETAFVEYRKQCFAVAWSDDARIGEQHVGKWSTM